MDPRLDSTTELVISTPQPLIGPIAYETRSRTTLGVLTQLLVEAEQRVIISAPFMQPGYGLSAGPMKIALLAALGRGVGVDILSTGLSLQTLSLGNLDLDEAKPYKVRLFRPQLNVINEQKIGSHAKFCVADGQAAYVGSANLTGPGLTDQVEMGLFVRGKIAQQIESFWKHAIEIGLFVRASE